MRIKFPTLGVGCWVLLGVVGYIYDNDLEANVWKLHVNRMVMDEWDYFGENRKQSKQASKQASKQGR